MPKLTPTAKRFEAHLHNEQFWPGLYAGLAQHHGIPTKLLDFSFNPINAVHFAVKSQEPNNICIWAVNVKYFQHKFFGHGKDSCFNFLLTRCSRSIQ